MSARGWWTQSWLIVALCASSQASAQSHSGITPALRGGAMSMSSAAPARYLATWSLGAPLRLTQDEDFGQDTTAPLFTDVFAGYVFPSGANRFRHGAGLGISVNLTDDGGYAEPVYAGEQVALMPAYMLYGDFGLDLFAKAHLGVPIVITGGSTAGVELAASIGYRLLAGLGLFAELFGDVFGGSGSKLYPTAGLELGLFLDYEALP